MTKVSASRRQILSFSVVAGCFPAPLLGAPSARGGFAAEFSAPDGSRISLNYWDAENFQLVPLVAGADTWVVRGRIYLVVRPSIITADAERVLWVGKLRDVPPPSLAVEPPLRATALAAGEVEAWALGAPVYDAFVADQGPARPAGALAVARLPQLAAAQYVVDRRMRAAMDMGLCGNGIDRVTTTWRSELTGAGLAVVGGGGVRLARPVRDLRTEPSRLPVGVAVEDYRLRPSG